MKLLAVYVVLAVLSFVAFAHIFRDDSISISNLTFMSIFFPITWAIVALIKTL